mgnify:CR=1 FL=1
MSKQVIDPKTGTYAKRVQDIRDYITDEGSTPHQLCTFLEAKLGDGLYDVVLDMWLAMPVPLANWCFDQILNHSKDEPPLTTEKMASNLQTAICTVYEILSLYKRSEDS